MTTQDISAIGTTSDWAATMDATFREAVKEAVRDNIKLGLAVGTLQVDGTASSLRDDGGDTYGGESSANPREN